jgi:hypothetical protein
MKNTPDHEINFNSTQAAEPLQVLAVAPRSQVEESEAYIANLEEQLLHRPPVDELIKELEKQIMATTSVDVKTLVEEQTHAFLLAEGMLTHTEHAAKKIKRSLLDFV